MKKIILIVLGFILLALGSIGIFLPVLPTTPFVLLAAFCFASSSPKLNLWLRKTKFFGEFIENYYSNGGVRKSVKIRAIIFLWIGLGISAVLVEKLFVRIILAIVGICVSLHILSLKNKRN